MESAVANVRAVAVRSLVRVREVRGRRLTHALTAASRRGDAGRAARLLRRMSLDVAAGSGRLRGRRPRRPLPTIVVLARSQFTEDARALAAQLGVERVLLMPREALKAIAGPQFPPEIGDLTYRTLEARDGRPMRRYRELLGAIWEALDPQHDIRMVLTANTGYWAEIELGAALDEHGVAFVALHKENLKSDGHARLWAAAYRTQRPPFRGRAVLVQNDNERALQVESGIVPADRIHVVGMARLDAFHAHRARTAGTPISGDVVVAGFLPGLNLPAPEGFLGRDPVTGVPIPSEGPRPEHLIDACIGLHRVAVAVAHALPERRVVLKTKGREQDRRWTPVLLAHALGAETLPGNLDVVHGGDAAAITREAGVVVGLNSTMLLEAIAAGRPAVSLEIGEACGAARDFIIDLSGAATVVTDEVDAVAAILRLLDAPPRIPAVLSERAKAVLDRWTGNADGDATPRTVSVLRSVMAATADR